MLTPLNLELEDTDPQAHLWVWPHRPPADLCIWISGRTCPSDKFLRRFFSCFESNLMGWFPRSLPVLKFHNCMKQCGSSLPRPTSLDWPLKKVANLFQQISFPLLSASPHSSFSDILSVISTPGPSYLLPPQPGPPSPKSSYGWLPHSIQVSSIATSSESTAHSTGLIFSFHPTLSWRPAGITIWIDHPFVWCCFTPPLTR